jgi:ketosteroid isomerase-like protein
MKNFLPIALLMVALASSAQTTADSNLKGLVDAEWAFINTAKEKNTRDAFIASLADDAITFGQDIQKGKEYLKTQQPNESWLYWEPVYSVIAASGDFGFNTGPWEFRQKKTDEKAVAFGQFVTVWKKINGVWKAAIDIGISHGAPAGKEIWRTSSVKSAPSKSVENKTDVMNFERQFQDDIVRKGLTAYRKFISPEARLYRSKREPFTSAEQIEKYLNETTEKITFASVDAEIASTGDLAFVYGRTVVREETDRNSFFMRIWRKENNTWKIVLDLVN